MTAAPEQIEMRTAKCEGCGCSWWHPCMVNATTQQAVPAAERDKIMAGKANPNYVITGCHWDEGYWRQNRAVCSVCSTTEGKVPA